MNHTHFYAPGQSLNQDPMLYCACGSQINCLDWDKRSRSMNGSAYWGMAVVDLQFRILRELYNQRRMK